MITEISVALLLLLEGVFFALGAQAWMERVWPTRVPGAAAGAVLLVFIFATLPAAVLPFAPLALFQVAAFIGMATGAVSAWRRRREFFGVLRGSAFVLCVSLFAFGFWAWVLRDLDGLVSYHDGIAHTAYFLRMIQNGQPLLHANPVSLRELFGEGYLRFYPGGSHAVAAIFSGWIPASWAMPSEILKAWLLLLTAGAPAIAHTIARALLPGRSGFVYAAVALAALTYFRFPIWQMSNGGFSRQLALFLLTPFFAEWLRASPPNIARRALLIVGPLAAFLFHPGILGLFALVALAGAWMDRPALRTVLGDALCAAFGFGAVWFLVRATGSDAHFVGVVAGVDSATVYSQLRNAVLLIPSTFDDFSHAAAAPLSARELLLYTVVCSAFVASLRPGFPRRLLALPWVLYLGLSAIFSLALCPFVFFQLIPQLFYNHPDRVAEIYYPALVLVWAMGAAILHENRRHRVGRFVFALLILLGMADTAKGLVYLARFVPQEMASYHSPSRRETGNLMEFVRAHVPANALVVAEPFIVDSLEARTGRQTLFIFSECPKGSVGENCPAREAFFQREWPKIQARIAQPDSQSACGVSAAPLDSRPVFWLVRGSSERPCRELRRVKTASGFDLLEQK